MSARDKIFGSILAIISALVLFTSILMLWHPVYSIYALTIIRIMTTLTVLMLFGILTWIGVEIVRTPSVEEIEAKSK